MPPAVKKRPPGRPVSPDTIDMPTKTIRLTPALIAAAEKERVSNRDNPPIGTVLRNLVADGLRYRGHKV